MEKLPSSPRLYGPEHIQDFYAKIGVTPNSFSFNPVSVVKIGDMLKGLNSKTTGLDNITARFLKDAADLIAPFMAHIINLSLEQGTVPDDMKHSKVIPLFKKGDGSDLGNNRPVSILSVASKVLEKVVNEQLYQYAVDAKLLYEFQSGFRQSHSTDSCLLYLTDIRGKIDIGKLCGMILIDRRPLIQSIIAYCTTSCQPWACALPP